MKSNKSMMDLALAYAKVKGPRVFNYNGTPKTAIYITKKEIMDLHYAEGFTNDRVINRRVDKWLLMDQDAWYGATGNYWVLQIYDTATKLMMEDYAVRNLTDGCIGQATM